MLIVIGICKTWVNWNTGSASSMPNVLDLFKVDPTLWLLCFERKLLLMFLSWCSVLLLCKIECWQTSMCQDLHIHLIHCTTSYFMVLKNQKCFTNIVHPPEFKISWRGVLAPEHEQLLHSLETFVKLLLVIILYTWAKPFRTYLWDFNHIILSQSPKKSKIN